ncbi:fusarin C cluster-peptidase [Fusarium acutatum]|uniref:Fusarin C cluster-peptidase n=1 Tax=Fusarium acutatum TaxID=78861 RepID=A0A8H4JCC3_9HYPO|nr:fusarin C cluster-peptidase [Fusarium acutatum]
MLTIATLYVALQVFGAFSPSHAAAVTLEHRSAGNSNVVAVPANWDVYGYLFNVTVGSPPQNITMLSDMSWMASFVRSGRCLGQFNPELCVAQGQSFFNEHDSTTFANTTYAQATWPVTAFAPNFTVDYGRDKFCIGQICNKDTLMQVSDFPYPGSVVPIIPFAGIFGLAPTPKAITATSEPANFQAWKNGKMGPLVGWHTCEVLKSAATCQGGDAQLVFGGTDTTMYSAKKLQSYEIQNPEWLSDAFYPSTPPRSNYWSTSLTGMWVKTDKLSKNYAVPFKAVKTAKKTPPLAVVDEGSEGLGAPLSLNGYKYLVRHIKGAKLASKTIVQNIQQQGSSGYNTANQDWYTVACDGLDEYPNLVYQLDGRKKYTISPGDYVTKLTDMPGSVCYLNVNVWKYGRTENGDARVVLLGKAFLKRKYLVLNFEERSFGLAPLLTG